MPVQSHTSSLIVYLMGSQPFFSVIVPVYQGELFLGRCLECVGHQTFEDWEILVVDNNSTDGTVVVARAWEASNRHRRFRLIMEPSQGPSAARNAGIMAAEGEWVSFLDADDVWYPTKLEKVADNIRKDPTCSLVCHDELAVSPGGRPRPMEHHRYYKPEVPLFIQLYDVNFLSPSAVSVRRQYLVQDGLFDTSLRCWEDHDLWLRLADRVKPCFVPEILGEYTEREDSAIRNLREGFVCNLRVRKRYFQEYAKTSNFAHLRFAWRTFRIYLGTAKACLVKGRLMELVQLTGEALLKEGLRPH
jgi:glycosyltransferase involved in cell wall biosynthesis